MKRAKEAHGMFVMIVRGHKHVVRPRIRTVGEPGNYMGKTDLVLCGVLRDGETLRDFQRRWMTPR